MNVAVTGANGFIGKNLISHLKTNRDANLMTITKMTSDRELNEILSKADFIFHFAGQNRSENQFDFQTNNVYFTEKIIKILSEKSSKAPILFASSILAESNSIYGQTKLLAEKLIKQYGVDFNVKVYIYRLTNVFGKWANPKYNSVVATFCHNISRGIPIEIHDETKTLRLHYIDDVIDAFLNCLKGEMNEIQFFETTLIDLARIINGFANCNKNLKVPNNYSLFEKYLYSTYTSYLPKDRLTNIVNSFKTDNSMFSELLKFDNHGQISINTMDSGAVRGNHWHHTKHEKFLVVQGHAIIRLRKLFTNDLIEISTTGDNLEWVEILPGFVHNIENVGDNPLLTIMWASEIYDSSKPDTFSEDV
jgi:UDP-2-acetamido-2,6-beta-L-arabino-hexul-4-ose reductase